MAETVEITAAQRVDEDPVGEVGGNVQAAGVRLQMHRAAKNVSTDCIEEFAGSIEDLHTVVSRVAYEHRVTRDGDTSRFAELAGGAT